ncbi:MAG: hypothetical protein JW860_04355, partial [Sedimentisphaerales bacterium]|nr:hypothetical protein [Sedimentisphaerales bacterium]
VAPVLPIGVRVPLPALRAEARVRRKDNSRDDVKARQASAKASADNDQARQSNNKISRSNHRNGPLTARANKIYVNYIKYLHSIASCITAPE